MINETYLFQISKCQVLFMELGGYWGILASVIVMKVKFQEAYIVHIHLFSIEINTDWQNQELGPCMGH